MVARTPGSRALSVRHGNLIQVLSRVDVGVWVARLRISAYRGFSVWEAVGGFEVYGFGFRCGLRVRPGFGSRVYG